MFLFLFIYFNWRIITLQQCIGFPIHSHESATGVHVSPILNSLPPPSPSHPQGHPSAPVLSTPSHALNLDWRSVSHMVIYMFQCYSLRSSHSRLLPQSPTVCSLHLCLFRCPECRVMVTIFLNSIHMRQYTVLVFFFLTYFTLYNTSLELIQMHSF